MEARCELEAAGLPYPRTCPVCKLGPCTRMERVPKLNAEAALQDAATKLRNHLSREIADLVTQGRLSDATALTDKPAWRFLGEIIGDVDPAPPAGQQEE